MKNPATLSTTPDPQSTRMEVRTGQPLSSPSQPNRFSRWVARILLLVTLATGVMISLNPTSRTAVLEIYHRIIPVSPITPIAEEKELETSQNTKPWDGLVSMTAEQAKTIGLSIEEVNSVSEPIRVEIYGNTAYDPNSLARIRPRFPSVVDKVHVTLGQRVTAGDPLLDLFSADLAAAKSDYEKNQSKWEHDLHELERAERLRKTEPPAISERDYLSLVNDEKVSRTEAKVAADKLQVYGLTQEGITRVNQETGTEKARLAVRSPADGMIVRRDAVQGNLYSADDTLLVISPVDHLWVYGHIYPSDANQIRVGQQWVIRIPGTGQKLTTKIDAIGTELDPESNTLLIRAQIPNLSETVKAEMLVGGYVEVPPPSGATILPRRGMVSTDGQDYAFILQTSSTLEPGKSPTELRFERRVVHVAIENHDQAIILDGLKPGDKVASRGALILSQLYEDAESSRPLAPGIPNQNGSNPTSGHLTNPHVRVTIR